MSGNQEDVELHKKVKLKEIWQDFISLISEEETFTKMIKNEETSTKPKCNQFHYMLRRKGTTRVNDQLLGHFNQITQLFRILEAKKRE